jgi:hypothetical protein
MPDRDVRTLRDLIWYQYAKIIAKRALGPDAMCWRFAGVAGGSDQDKELK